AALHDLDSAAGAGGNPSPEVRGSGDVAAADANQCPNLATGTTFKAAFTTYYNLAANQYGIAGAYDGVYQGSDPAFQGKGDFFCAVAMECGCPTNLNLKEQSCSNGRRTWYPCNFFSSTTTYCDSNPQQYRSGETVAASSCFPKGCVLKVN